MASTRENATPDARLGVEVHGTRASPFSLILRLTVFSIREHLDYIQDAGFTASTSNLAINAHILTSHSLDQPSEPKL